MKQAHDLKIISFHTLFDSLKQHHNEVNELRAKTLARTANQLELVATTHGKSQAAIRNKGKEILRTPSPTSESEHEYEYVNDLEDTQIDKEIHHVLALIFKTFQNIYKPTKNNLKISSNTQYRTVENPSRNDRRTRNNRQKGKNKNQREVVVARNMKIGQLSVEEHDCRPTYGTKSLEKIQSNDEYNGFATDQQHTEQSESINDTYVVDKDDKYVTSNLSNMSSNEGEVDQDAGKNNDERELD
ncbi:hypothetical protein Tco_1055276 [Tanacetum coccineum]|uniref:Uncharacterized protein n=1 Tax=Tanacetum coccineum TaxID=301880 RepID=A0ABQ5GZI4_9ASTR